MRPSRRSSGSVWPPYPRARGRTPHPTGGMLGSERANGGRTDTRDARPGRLDLLERGLAHLSRTQHADGSWHGDYGGPMFLLPLYVATCRVTGLELEPAVRQEMLRHLKKHQNPHGRLGLPDEATGPGVTAPPQFRRAPPPRGA